MLKFSPEVKKKSREVKSFCSQRGSRPPPHSELFEQRKKVMQQAQN